MDILYNIIYSSDKCDDINVPTVETVMKLYTYRVKY